MSSTSAAWISGRTSDTRSSGMPRMRSASMALLGLDETRISFSDALTPRILRQRAERAGQARLEPIGCREADEATANEQPEAALDVDASAAIRTAVYVLGEDLLLVGSEL